MNNKDIKISIVTVVYNGVATIERTIKSILESQSYENIEYIIIDGDSNDGTVEIIKQYESKLAYWHCQKDDGIYNAMNIGISKTTGDYIALVNADDWLEEDIIKNIVNILRHDDSIDILHGNLNYMKNGTSRIHIPKINKSIFFIPHIVFYHPTFFVHKRVYEEMKYDEDYKLLSDYKFILQTLSKKINFYYYNKNISNFLSGGASSNFLISLKERQRIQFEMGYNIFQVYSFSISIIIKRIAGYLKMRILDGTIKNFL